MLVVSRYKGDSLMIGDDIVVQVVEIRGDKVRLGIVCPANASVHRREVYDAIMRERQSEDASHPQDKPAEEA